MSRIIRFEATLPPVRQRDVQLGCRDRGDSLCIALVEPGSWSSEVVRNGKRITWTMTIPDCSDLSDFMHVQEMAERVGYYCSDTIGPKSRKAMLRWHFGAGDWHGPIICPGSY